MLKYGAVLPISGLSSKNNSVRNINKNLSTSSSTSLINTYPTDPTFNSVVTNQLISNNITLKTNNTNQPIINHNNYEKKYVVKVTTTGIKDVYFKNILNSPNEQITFIGKIISRDENNNIASFQFSGYSKLNVVNFTVNTLYSDDPINWKIISIYINNVDLVIQISSNQISTNWVISVESISI